jgi:hypothetical protein
MRDRPASPISSSGSEPESKGTSLVRRSTSTAKACRSPGGNASKASSNATACLLIATGYRFCCSAATIPGVGPSPMPPTKDLPIKVDPCPSSARASSTPACVSAGRTSYQFGAEWQLPRGHRNGNPVVTTRKRYPFTRVFWSPLKTRWNKRKERFSSTGTGPFTDHSDLFSTT